MTIKATVSNKKLLVKDSYKYPSEFDSFQRNAFPKSFSTGKVIKYGKTSTK
jgi:hypothetical protein